MSASRIVLNGLALLLLILPAACARKAPPLLPLPPERAAQIRQQLLARPPGPEGLDLDLEVSLQAYGRGRFSLPASLQMLRRGYLRFSGLDPLGRPLFVLVAGGDRFTLIDTGQGRAYTGGLDAEYLHRYLPAHLDLPTCFDLLAARLPPLASTAFSLGSVQGTATVWLAVTRKQYSRRAELDPASGRLFRQLIVGPQDRVAVQVRYRYENDAAKQPRALIIDGEAVTGTIELIVTRRYPASSMNPDIFRQHVPSAFSVTEVR